MANVCEGIVRWSHPLLYLSLCKEERRWVWRLEAPQQSSQLVPLRDQAPPLMVHIHLPPCPVAHFSSPDRTLPSTCRVDISGQESKLLCSVRGECLLSSPSGGANLAVGLPVPILMPVSLSSLCPRAPGAGCGVAWAGSPASASGPCRGSPSRRGTPTTSASASGTSGWHAGKGR